jgi:hypothetical protein
VLRLISAVLHRRRGGLVTDDALDLRPAELGVIVPLVACLIALSVWPAAVSGHSFPAGSFSPFPGVAQAAQVNCVEIPAQPEVNKCMTLPERRAAAQSVVAP